MKGYKSFTNTIPLLDNKREFYNERILLLSVLTDLTDSLGE